LILTGSTDPQLTNWSTTSPYYSGSGFDATSGTYTVPTTGKYAIKVTINYNTTSPITTPVPVGTNPAFAVQRITPNPTTLVAGNVGLFSVNTTSPSLDLTVILANQCITLAGDVQLNAGDQIGVFYVQNNLGVTIVLGNVNPPGAVWSMHGL
jgi:hypothetical protein